MENPLRKIAKIILSGFFCAIMLSAEQLDIVNEVSQVATLIQPFLFWSTKKEKCYKEIFLLNEGEIYGLFYSGTSV